MLINSVYDFIPATGQAAAAEDSRVLIDQQQACYRCHGSDRDNSEARLLMHGSKRFAFEGCVMCHTSYSGDPETGSALDMATLTHKIHHGEYKVVGYQAMNMTTANCTIPVISRIVTAVIFPMRRRRPTNTLFPAITAA